MLINNLCFTKNFHWLQVWLCNFQFTFLIWPYHSKPSSSFYSCHFRHMDNISRGKARLLYFRQESLIWQFPQLGSLTNHYIMPCCYIVSIYERSARFLKTGNKKKELRISDLKEGYKIALKYNLHWHQNIKGYIREVGHYLQGHKNFKQILYTYSQLIQ